MPSRPQQPGRGGPLPHLQQALLRPLGRRGQL